MDHRCPECGSANIHYSLDFLAGDNLCLIRSKNGRMILCRIKEDGTTEPADDRNANWDELRWCADCTAEF